MPDIKPIKITLTEGESEQKMTSFLDDRLLAIKKGLVEFHTVQLPMWKEIYEAEPLEQTKSFPFQNASNLVVPIAAIHSDTLKARLMAGIFKTDPIWIAAVHGSFAGEGTEAKHALEDFLQAIATEPDELDLYRVYNDILGDVINYGTMIVKSPWEHLTIDQATGDGTGKPLFTPEVVYDGPRPEKIALQDFYMSPADKSLERSPFKAHKRKMLKYELEDRAFSQIYDKAAVEKVLKSPEGTGATNSEQKDSSNSQIKVPQGEAYQYWEIFECWALWRDNNLNCKIIVTYHPASKTILRAIYNFLPDDPFVGARLLLRDGNYFGYGLCEILSTFQEETSQIHNQRRDAQTVANTKVWRVDPLSKLHDGYQIYPSAMLPAAKDEIEPMSHGEPSEINIEEEKLTLELAERRSGVSPPMQGAGSGSFSKRGVYSAMGTMSLLQEGSSRTDLAIGDVRYFHTKLGRIVSRQYAAFGLQNSCINQFGAKADVIRTALKAILEKKMFLRVGAPTASVNREVEKQNDIMLASIMAKHYQMITGMLAQASSGQVPPQVAEYLTKAIGASNKFMTMVLQHFGYDEPELYTPEVGNGAEGQEQFASGTPGNAADVAGAGAGGNVVRMPRSPLIPGLAVGGTGSPSIPPTP